VCIRDGRRRSASLLTYFAAPRVDEQAEARPRIGFTTPAGPYGKLWHRNRIRRRHTRSCAAAICRELTAKWGRGFAPAPDGFDRGVWCIRTRNSAGLQAGAGGAGCERSQNGSVMRPAGTVSAGVLQVCDHAAAAFSERNYRSCGGGCRFQPTCSEYAAEALSRFARVSRRVGLGGAQDCEMSPVYRG